MRVLGAISKPESLPRLFFGVPEHTCAMTYPGTRLCLI